MAGISKTVVSIQPGKMEEMTKYIDSQAGLVTEVDGMIGFAVAVTGEDEITIIGVYESSKDANAAADEVSSAAAADNDNNSNQQQQQQQQQQ